ncbi:ABC transporter ATP-binding protein [Anaerosporomusa subterranea]|uniref:ABC transporter ATP-binding protein n=1 Tax=Anaerosporomusa subterranea TaxID=1794912 RepID=A0A154BPT3_ANASB|nr:ABC transporter ATP-binding protein [Anaerosporomusa subterranea]KYZ75994.1 ABC transporter ATP-binding protein [Anaerosporomusa subterranea]
MLKINNLYAHYGNIEALHGVSLEVGNKDIVALIGSNGAGKTTLLRAISSLVTRNGEICYNGENIEKQSPRYIAKAGLLHVPEGRHVFPGLTVQQNLEVGSVSWRGIKNASVAEDLERVFSLFPRLEERRKQYAWSLSGGEQQMLAIGRAIMGRPKLLMLDEPSMGLAPKVIDELFVKILEINSMGVPILLVEQNALLAMEVSQKVYILEGGRIVLQGDSKDIINDARVKEAYLGKLKEKVV